MADCWATFPGVTSADVKRFSGTEGNGSDPGRFTLSVARESVVATDGELQFSDGVRTITIPGCRRVDARWNGPLYDITLEDRRWRWRTGVIFGKYNTPLGESEEVEHEQTPQQLAALLWAEMNETNLDATLLPNDARPAVDWYGANPADELIALCQLLGCVLSPMLDGTWKIWPLGSGSLYVSASDRFSTDLVQDFAAYPDQISALTGPIQYEVVFALEPIGEEIDGRMRPHDLLSYAPVAGWQEIDDDCEGIEGTYSKNGRTLNLKDLARRHLRKTYRIGTMPSGTGAASLNPPGYPDALPDITSVRQLLPLTPNVNEVETTAGDPDFGKRKPAEVWGRFVRGGKDEDEAGTITRPGTIVHEGYSINADKGIVRFSQPMSLPGDTGREPAELYLRCVVEIDHTTLNSTLGHVKFVNTGLSNGTGAELIEKTDLTLQWRPIWNNDGTAQDPGVGNPYPGNLTELEAELDHYLNAKAAGYVTQSGGTEHFSGLHAPSLNGRVSSVTWAWGTNRAPVTTVGIGSKANPLVSRFDKDRVEKLSKSQRLRRERREALRARGLFRGEP